MPLWQVHITDLINGQTDGKELAKHRHYDCRKPESEIAKALHYNGRDDHLFALEQEWATYLHLQGHITRIDEQIKKHLMEVIDCDADKKRHVAREKPYKRKNKNTIRGLDMNQVSYQYFEGVDLMAIEGANDATIMAIIGEIGLEGIKNPAVPNRPRKFWGGIHQIGQELSVINLLQTA